MLECTCKLRSAGGSIEARTLNFVFFAHSLHFVRLDICACQPRSRPSIHAKEPGRSYVYANCPGGGWCVHAYSRCERRLFGRVSISFLVIAVFVSTVLLVPKDRVLEMARLAIRRRGNHTLPRLLVCHGIYGYSSFLGSGPLRVVDDPLLRPGGRRGLPQHRPH